MTDFLSSNPPPANRPVPPVFTPAGTRKSPPTNQTPPRRHSSGHFLTTQTPKPKEATEANTAAARTTTSKTELIKNQAQLILTTSQPKPPPPITQTHERITEERIEVPPRPNIQRGAAPKTASPQPPIPGPVEVPPRPNIQRGAAPKTASPAPTLSDKKTEQTTSEQKTEQIPVPARPLLRRRASTVPPDRTTRAEQEATPRIPVPTRPRARSQTVPARTVKAMAGSPASAITQSDRKQNLFRRMFFAFFKKDVDPQIMEQRLQEVEERTTRLINTVLQQKPFDSATKAGIKNLFKSGKEITQLLEEGKGTPEHLAKLERLGNKISRIKTATAKYGITGYVEGIRKESALLAQTQEANRKAHLNELAHIQQTIDVIKAKDTEVQAQNAQLIAEGKRAEGLPSQLYLKNFEELANTELTFYETIQKLLSEDWKISENQQGTILDYLESKGVDIDSQAIKKDLQNIAETSKAFLTKLGMREGFTFEEAVQLSTQHFDPEEMKEHLHNLGEFIKTFEDRQQRLIHSELFKEVDDEFRINNTLGITAVLITPFQRLFKYELFCLNMEKIIAQANRIVDEGGKESIRDSSLETVVGIENTKSQRFKQAIAAINQAKQ